MLVSTIVQNYKANENIADNFVLLYGDPFMLKDGSNTYTLVIIVGSSRTYQVGRCPNYCTGCSKSPVEKEI